MAETVREQLIRLGIITPAPLPAVTENPVVSTKTPVSANVEKSPPAKKQKRSTKQPEKPPRKSIQEPWSAPGRIPQRSATAKFREFRLADYLQERPGTEDWYLDLRGIEKFLETAPQKDFRDVIASKKFEDVLNIYTFIRRICSSPIETKSWLVEMAWQFSDLSGSSDGHTYRVWSDYEDAKRRYQRALLIWEVSRGKPRPAEYYGDIVKENTVAGMYESWLECVWPNCSQAEQRKAEVRVMLAAYVVQVKKEILGVKTSYEEPAKSVWELGGSTRRFGGGRPRSERYKR